MKPNEGNYNFLLNAQGRIQGDATIFAQPDALLIETAATQLPNLLAHLDHFIIMDDVELTDISATQSGILVAGPQAPFLLAKIRHQRRQHRTPHHKYAAVERRHRHRHPRPQPAHPQIRALDHPRSRTRTPNCPDPGRRDPLRPPTLESLRILEGTPLYGTDIRNSEKARELPQETAQTRALHFNKGCYLGQEIVERIRSRGNVHRTFAAFRLDGQLPAAGSPLEAENKAVGELTSVANIDLPGGSNIQLALGYIRREALDRNLPLHYPGGTATPVQLPYPAASSVAASIRIREKSTQMPEQNKPFVITDRRKFTLDGEPRPDADPSPESEEREEPKPPEPAAAAPQPTPVPTPEAASSDESEPSSRLHPPLKKPTRPSAPTT